MQLRTLDPRRDQLRCGHIIIGIPSPLTPSYLTFLQILPTLAFLSSSGLITWILQTVYSTSEHIRFYFLVFLFYTF